MTSNSPQPPDPDRVEKGFKAIASLTNTLMEFLRWVAGMIRKQQWGTADVCDRHILVPLQ